MRHLSIVLTLVVLVAMPLEMTTAVTASSRVIVVGFADAIPADVETLLADHGGTMLSRDDRLRFVTAETTQPDSFVQEMLAEPGVRYAEPEVTVRSANTVLLLVSSPTTCTRDCTDATVPPGSFPSDPLYWEDCTTFSCQWGPRLVHAREAWLASIGQSPILVATTDSGVDHHHDDLRQNVLRRQDLTVDGLNLVPGGNPSDPMDDTSGHGTAVAGILAATIDNKIGIAGMSQSKILAVRCIGTTVSAYLEGRGSHCATAIAYAAARGAKVITASWTVDVDATFIRDAVEFARGQGALVVAAAGNENRNEISYPARYGSVVAVTGLTPASTPSGFSNKGVDADVAAPAGGGPPLGHDDILSLHVGNAYGHRWGTSLAVPFVAGTASLMLAARPDLQPHEVFDLINQTAEDVHVVGKDPATGWGRLHVKAALDAAVSHGSG